MTEFNGTDFSNFIDSFRIECIANQQETLGLGLELSFIQCAYERTDASEVGPLSLVFFDGKVGKERVKIEGFRYDDDDGTLVLAVADFDSFKRENRLTETDIITIANRIRNFYKLIKLNQSKKIISSLNIDISTPEYDMLDGIESLSVQRLQLMIFTDKELSERIKTFNLDPVEDTPVEIQLWDLKRIYNFELSNGATEARTYSFKEHPVMLNLASEGENFKSYIGLISAELLAKMYKAHGGKLLESNVRSFLSNTTAVNKNIRKTINNTPERFFILNNGIAVTARKLKFDESNMLIEADDFQIINGGQTTATLSSAYYVDKKSEMVKKAAVPIKLTELSDTLTEQEVTELVSEISKASNNQNKVTEADFFSNHPFHIDMERKSKTLAASAKSNLSGTFWYYERSKGAYKQMMMFETKAGKAKFELQYPKKQVVKKEDLARVRLCWSDTPSPNIVSKGATALFSKFSKIIEERWDNRENTGYFSDNYYKDSVSLIIMLRDLKSAIQNPELCPWYEGGYLANIATYSISVLAEHVITEWKNLQSFNLNKIWKNQEVPKDLLDLMISIAKRINESITNPPKGSANVTQWCKQENCWTRIKSEFAENILSSDIERGYRLSKEEKRENKYESKTKAKIDSGIDAQTRALSYKHWKEAFAYNTTHNVTGGKWEKAIADLISMRKIDEITCKIALEALKQLQDGGFDL